MADSGRESVDEVELKALLEGDLAVSAGHLEQPVDWVKQVLCNGLLERVSLGGRITRSNGSILNLDRDATGCVRLEAVVVLGLGGEHVAGLLHPLLKAVDPVQLLFNAAGLVQRR
jgi:hypothetical protein